MKYYFRLPGPRDFLHWWVMDYSPLVRYFGAKSTKKKNMERFTNLRVILAGAMLIFSVSFQFYYMYCVNSTLTINCPFVIYLAVWWYVFMWYSSFAWKIAFLPTLNSRFTLLICNWLLRSPLFFSFRKKSAITHFSRSTWFKQRLQVCMNQWLQN